MNPERRSLAYGLSLVPMLVLACLMVRLRFYSFGTVGSFNWQANIAAHSRFWGGNAAEIFTHWANALFLAGSAFLIAWHCVIAALFRGRQGADAGLVFRLNSLLTAELFVLYLLAIYIDFERGEGGVFVSVPFYFLPLLLTSRVILVHYCEKFLWRAGTVSVCAVTFLSIHIGALMVYEPSDSGHPNLLILPLWFGCLVAAATIRKKKRDTLSGTSAIEAAQSESAGPGA